MKKQITKWFSGLSKAGRLGIIIACFLVAGTVSAAIKGPSNSVSKPNSGNSQTQKSNVETRTVTTTVVVPFSSSTVQDATLDQGTSKITTVGVNGVKTQTWAVTTDNGKETRRELISEAITTPAVDQVTTQGTYVKPAPSNCPNGTYVNTSGNTVCSPYSAPTTPAGATARCVDGTYSFSQSRSGTCSHHGGVAVWL